MYSKKSVLFNLKNSTNFSFKLQKRFQKLLLRKAKNFKDSRIKKIIEYDLLPHL